jgi:lipopolysaccharide export system protein LptA
VFFSLFVLLITYLIISPSDDTFFTQDKSDRLAEFRQARVVGRQDGKTVWELNAGSGWSDKAQEVTYLADLKQGKIFNKKGQLVLHSLNSPAGRAWRHSEVVEASGGVSAMLDIGKLSPTPKKKADWSRMRGRVITYYPAEKKSEISGQVSLAKRDSVINAARIVIDHDRRIAAVSGEVTLARRDSDVRADNMEYFGETEALSAAGRVRLKLKESRTSTVIKCGRVDFFIDLNKDMELTGSLEVTQGKKLTFADSGTYSRGQKKLFLRGNTRTVLEKAGSALKPETISRLDSPEQKKLLRQKTVILAREMLFSLKTGDARATGSVEVSQRGRKARSDSAFYDDRNETLRLTGNVHLKRESEWLSCREVFISVKNETFEARGVAESRFNL